MPKPSPRRVAARWLQAELDKTERIAEVSAVLKQIRVQGFKVSPMRVQTEVGVLLLPAGWKWPEGHLAARFYPLEDGTWFVEAGVGDSTESDHIWTTLRKRGVSHEQLIEWVKSWGPRTPWIKDAVDSGYAEGPHSPGQRLGGSPS